MENHESQKITIKEVYKKVIKLEVMLEEGSSQDRKTRRMFQFLAVLIIVIGVLNIIIHVWS